MKLKLREGFSAAKQLYTALAFTFLLLGFTSLNQLSAQVFDVPQTGSDTSNSCFGILRDPGGTGNYLAYANGYFVIDPPGNSAVSLIFSSFFTQQFSDYVRVYDGIGTSGTLIGSYSGNSLPSGGSAVTSTQGAITVQFSSNCCTHYAGFQLTWTAASGAAPNASFAVNTAPAYNTPVQFFNTTTNGGNYLWEFGDGSTSTDANPVHNYVVAGAKQVRLIATNCAGTDTSSYTTVNVQAAPVGTISTDTVNMTLACGSSNSSQFSISNAGTGSLSYALELQQSVANSVMNETFETSNLGVFTNQNTSITNTTFQTTGAPQGSTYLDVTGGGWINDGLKATLSPNTPEYISYRVKGSNSNYHGYVRFQGKDNFNTQRDLFISYFRYGQLRIDYGLATGGSTTYFHSSSIANTWYNIELKNIDFAQQSYDIYLDGVAIVTNARFININMVSLDEVMVHNNYTATVGVDDFQIASNDLLSKITFNPKTGNLNNGSSNVIFLNADATNLNAGIYWLRFLVTSNDTALNGKTVYLKLEVTGTAILAQSLNCINYGTVFTGFSQMDSVLLSNSGCDTLNFTSITASNADITASTNQLSVAPGDSVYLFVSLNSSAPGTYVDTVYLNGPDTNSVLCINASAVGAPSVLTDSTSYTVNYVGCLDTVSFPLIIYNTGQGNLNWSTSSGLSSTITDDFESTILDPTIWSSFGAGAATATNCGIVSGSRSLSFRGGARFVNTIGLNTTNGGNISYTMKQGNCELADGGEGIYLEYSTDGGSNWINIRYDYTSSTLTTITVNEPIPNGAKGANVMFRMIQKSYNGSTFDTWIIDDFSITAGINNVLVFSPDTSVVAPNDSVLVTAKIGVQGLTTGTYNFQAYIKSNDPSNPVYTFPVTLNLTGIPNIAVPTTCANYDTIMTGASKLDSIMVINDGCGDLILSNLSTSTTEFSVVSGLSTILPGDTAYLSVLFTGSSTLGVINDTLTISSNDTLAKVCLIAYTIGAPAALVTPDSLYASFNSCNDSITIPITLKNSGLSTLNYSLQGSSTGNIKLVLYQYNRYNTEYQNIKSIVSQLPNITLIESNATTSTAMINDLNGADVLIIPEGGSFLPTAVVTPIQNFVNGGGSYIHLLNSGGYLNQFGILPNVSFTSSISSGLINNELPSHPIMNGLGANLTRYSATIEISVTGSNYTVLAKRPSSASNTGVVVTAPYGSGQGIFIGYDFFAYGIQTENLLRQAVIWGAGQGLPNHISVTPDSGAVATSDSVVLNVTLRTAGLNSGRDSSTIIIETNDPSNPTISIPVVIDVNGKSQMELRALGCVDFDSLLVGASALDSIMVKNIGCDSLTISGASSSSGDFTLSLLPSKIAAGDSAMIWLNYTPSTIGTNTDTLFIFGDSDTLGLCVKGIGLGAPVTVANPDTLRVTVNKCHGFSIEDLVLQNTGQGNMSYDIRLAELYSDTSRALFSSSGASTSHSFTNTPSTTDTIWFTVVVNGDFDQSIENFSVVVEGTTIGSGLTNNLTIGQNDTVRLFYAGPNIATWLSDNILDVTIQNTSSVGFNFTNGLDLHFVKITMGGVSPPWLTMISPKTGNLAISSIVTKSLIFDPVTLAAGTYTTTINILSNDPVNPLVSVPVIFEVIDEAEIAISDTCLIFGTTLVGDTASSDLWIYNLGCKDLSVSGIISAGTNFTVSPSTGIIPAGDSLLINVQFVPTGINTFNSNMIINNSDSTLVVCVVASSNAKPVTGYSYSIENQCTGEVLFSDSSQFNPTSYYWDFGDGTTSTQSIVTHVFSQPGTYKVFFRTANAAGFDTISRYITINPFVGSFDMSNDTVLINAPINFYDSTVVANKWTWDFGDGNTSSVQNPTHTYAAVGTYTVNLIAEDSRNCLLNLFKTVYVVDDIGLNEWFLDGFTYSLFPNPAKDKVNLEAYGIDWSDYELTIIDATGKIVKRINTSGINKVEIDLSSLSAGMYQFTISKDGTPKTRRSVIVE